MENTIYILIPGLSDQRRFSRWFYRLIEERWTQKGMPTRTFHSKWQSSEDFGPKFERLQQFIEQEQARHSRVVLVGVSAGATLGLLAFCRRRGDVDFVSVCGFTQLRPHDRQNSLYMRLSWYKGADTAERAAQELDAKERSTILSLFGRSDGVIEPSRQRITGANNIKMWSRGHVFGIVVALIVYRRLIVRFTSRDSG